MQVQFTFTMPNVQMAASNKCTLNFSISVFVLLVNILLNIQSGHGVVFHSLILFIQYAIAHTHKLRTSRNYTSCVLWTLAELTTVVAK